MLIQRPDCSDCIHSEICFQKSMSQSIVDDIGKVKYLTGKDYATLLTCFSLELKCRHFIKKNENVFGGNVNYSQENRHDFE